MAKTRVDDDKSRPPPSPPVPMPWLIYTHKYKKKVQVFSTACFNKKSYLKSIPALRDKNVLGSQFGWLILETHKTRVKGALFDITLYNPVTSVTIDMPQYEYVRPDNDVWCCFTSSPSVEIDHTKYHSKKCFLVIIYSTCIASWCPYRTSSDGSSSSRWFSKGLKIDGVSSHIRSTATLDEVIYCVALTYKKGKRIRTLLSFESVDGNGSNCFAFRPLPFTLPDECFSPMFARCCYEYMVESCGRLYIAQVGICKYSGVVHVKVFELDLGKKIAVEIHSLGDRAFFLGPKCCSWCWASSNCESIGGVKGNCLYISEPRLTEDGLILYRLDGCTSTVLPNPKLKGLSNYHPIWLMPQLSPHHHRLSVPSKREQSLEKDDECEMLPQKTETEGKSLPELPLHLIELLAKNLHLFDCWSFRCISKAFHSIIPAPQLRSKDSSPLFLIIEDGDGQCRLMDPCRNDSRSCILRLSQYYYDIEFSTDGWLLVSDGTSLKLFNPFTRQMEILPYLDSRYSRMSFSIDPTSSKYLAVAIQGTRIYYLRSGEIGWNYCSFANNDYLFIRNYAKPIYHSGAFYFLSDDGYLGELKIVEGQPEWRVYDKIFTKPRKLSGRVW